MPNHDLATGAPHAHGERGRDPLARRLARHGRVRLALTLVLAAVFLLVTLPTVGAWEPESYVPDSEAELFVLTNQARASAGLAPLRRDSTLNAVARQRSKDMGDRQYFSHNIPPSGEMVFAVLDRMDYCYTVAGENIGWSTYPDEDATIVIQQMFMDSPTHRENILNPRWDNVGLGAYQAADGKKLWTVLFSVPCGGGTTAAATPTPRATPRPTAAPSPTRAATRSTKSTTAATPRPTRRPTPEPTLEPTSEPTPVPTTPVPATPAPATTASPTPPPSPLPTPVPLPSPSPSATSEAGATPIVSLRVVGTFAAPTLLDATLGGIVAGLLGG